jgi:hypothetical protein
MRAARSARWGLLLLALAGCQSKLNVEKTFTIEPTASHTIDIDPPRYQQVQVIAVSSDTPVDVFVYLKKDQAAAERAIETGKVPERVLASKQKVKNETIEATVPEKEGAMVTVCNSTKTATVKVKIVGK